MSFKIGIVGLPNVGKSTLFKALTKKQVLIANYPFATIDPNVGVVEVPDERLQALAEVSHPKKIIPTTIEFYDIAGLVRGASLGEGLGNQFLSYIREVDAIAEVIRVFSDPNIIHVYGKPDPKNDMEIIGLELCMADLKTVEKRRDDVSGRAKAGDVAMIKIKDMLERIIAGLNKGVWAKDVPLNNDEEKNIVRELCLLTMKPVLYVLNIDEQSADNSNKTKNILGDTPEDLVVEISAKIESELSELAPEEAKEMMASLNMKESGLDQFIKKSYKLLDLITFLTSGEDETRAWTIKNGAKAPQAAGVIHSDFEKGFIRAEIINWKDFVTVGGEAKAKEKGLMHLEGKDYVMKDGDVCYFRVAT